ncbi:MAG TPA: exopolysaccharide biosynthesis protein [Woeseiaceae bacterium]|nr:exopolysaccharide biosynthesis protein [Woeseiaceae bacterium]
MSNARRQHADEPPARLEQVLDRLADAREEDGNVQIGRLVEAVGRRSFGPVLLLAGLIAVSPLSGVPGMPTTVAVIVTAVAVQFLMGRSHFWLPQWVQKRKISHDRFCKTVAWLRKPARFTDGLLKQRLEFLTHDAGIHAIAVLVVIIAATMPPLEIVPFAATTAGLALTAFGLAVIAHDGLVALVALAITVGVAGLVIYSFL